MCTTNTNLPEESCVQGNRFGSGSYKYNCFQLICWSRHVGDRVVPIFSIFTGYLVDASSCYLFLSDLLINITVNVIYNFLLLCLYTSPVGERSLIKIFCRLSYFLEVPCKIIPYSRCPCFPLFNFIISRIAQRKLNLLA